MLIPVHNRCSQWLARRTAQLCRFKQEGDALDAATELAANMRVYSPEHTLAGPYLHSKWDPHLVQQLLTLLAADSPGMRVDVQTSDYEQLQEQFAKAFEVRC